MTKTTVPRRGAVMADWLDLHGLSPETCIAILESRQPSQKHTGLPKANLQLDMPSTKEAKGLCLDALTKAFPDKPAALVHLEADTVVNFSPDLDRFPRAFTLHNDGQGRPYISCPWSGRLSDFLTLAHELGHALQIILSEARDMPPIAREICAYLSEAWLIDHLTAIDHVTATPLKRIRQHRRNQVLSQGSSALLESLNTPTKPYDYNWNYPLAEHLASVLLERQNPSLVAAFFSGLTPLTRLTEAQQT